MLELQRIADEFWDKSKGSCLESWLYLVTSFLSFIFFIVIFFQEFEGSEKNIQLLVGSLLYLLMFFSFVYGLHKRNLYLLRNLGVKDTHEISFQKSGARLTQAKEKLLKEMLKQRKIIPQDIINSHLLEEKLKSYMPDINLEPDYKSVIHFVYNKEAKGRILSLFIALLALVSSLLWRSVSPGELKLAIETMIINNSSLLKLATGLFLFLVILMVVYLFFIKPLMAFSFNTLIPSNENKKNHLVQSCLKICTINDRRKVKVNCSPRKFGKRK